MGPFERREHAEEVEKRDHRKGGKDAPLNAARLQEDLRVAEGAKPEQVDPIRDGRAASEDDDGKSGEDEEKYAAARPRWLWRQRPINGFGQFFTPLYSRLPVARS